MESVSRHKNRKKRPKRRTRKPPERNKTQEVPVLTVIDDVRNSAESHPLVSVLGLLGNKFLHNCRGILHLFLSILVCFGIILQKCMGHFVGTHSSQNMLNSRAVARFRKVLRRYADYFQIDPYFPIFLNSEVWAYFCSNLQKYAGWFKFTHEYQTFLKGIDLHVLAQKCRNMKVIFGIFPTLIFQGFSCDEQLIIYLCFGWYSAFGFAGGQSPRLPVTFIHYFHISSQKSKLFDFSTKLCIPLTPIRRGRIGGEPIT